ncbi:MAG: DNA polymerase III subunit delta' [Deltaproteobacteria bacterium]|jgi:DNA polymerase-3 subunit delta'|nr:DNA polymerase III subunit delta' [Deltaproteobacteria bacterium]
MPWEMIGQDRPIKSLTDMIQSQRLPHGLMFTGTKGTGKYSLALSLAQALNCEKPQEDLSPCRKCPSCKKIADQVHPDVMTLTPQGKLNIIPIESIRELRESLSFRPYEGKYKVAIIREAERFREEAGGALLKTLEEPTPETILILTAQSPSSVMETLVSRCVKIKLRPLSRNQVLQTLTDKGFDLKASFILAGLSGGALGVALDIDSEKISSIWNNIDNVFGQAEPSRYLRAALEWSKTLALLVGKVEKTESEDQAKTSLVPQIVNCLRLWWRDVMVLAVTNDIEALLGPPPSVNQKKWAEKITARVIKGQEKAMARLTDGLNRSINVNMLFENYWLDMVEYL